VKLLNRLLLILFIGLSLWFLFFAGSITYERRQQLLAQPVGVGQVIPKEIYPPPWAVGEIDQTLTGNIQGTICNKHWTTKLVRPSTSYTNKIKFQQMKLLGYTDPKNYEEDHLISLILAGSPTSKSNLWPESHVSS